MKFLLSVEYFLFCEAADLFQIYLIMEPNSSIYYLQKYFFYFSQATWYITITLLNNISPWNLYVLYLLCSLICGICTPLTLGRSVGIFLYPTNQKGWLTYLEHSYFCSYQHYFLLCLYFFYYGVLFIVKYDIFFLNSPPAAQ